MKIEFEDIITAGFITGLIPIGILYLFSQICGVLL